MVPAIEVQTGYVPHRWQAEIHQRLRRFSVLVCHRRFGKTYLAINLLVDAALRTRANDARFAYVAPYLKQAKQVSWDHLKRFGLVVPGTRANEAETSLDFPNGSRIRLYGSDNGEAIRGLYFNGVVMDEMADFRPETWPEIIRPALADRRGWALFIGTPKGVDQFYELYQQARTDPGWYTGLYRADETGLIDAEELRMAQSTMSANQYRQEFLCDFAASVDNVLIPVDQVAEAAGRHIDDRDLAGLPHLLGVDVARFGDDRSVIQRRCGLCAYQPTVVEHADNMRLAGLVAQEIVAWRPDAVFIDAGRGEGVIDRLRQLGHSVVEVNFGGKADNPRYANKRVEMWDSLARWIKSGGAIPNNPDLKTDLCTPTYSFDAGNRMQLERKDEIKRRGLRSPDLADALALTFAYPVAQRRSAAAPQFVQHEFDPYQLGA